MIDDALAVVDQNRPLPREQQFAWTVPGWPMHQVLDWPEQTPERKHRVEQALQDGRFVMHALPFTTHTESLEYLAKDYRQRAEAALRNLTIAASTILGGLVLITIGFVVIYLFWTIYIKAIYDAMEPM